EVDEYTLAALLLPPVRRDEIGPAPFELAGEGDCTGTDLVGIPAGLESGVHVQPTIAARLRVTGDPDVLEKVPHGGGGLSDLLEGNTGLRIEIDAQLVGVLG